MKIGEKMVLSIACASLAACTDTMTGEPGSGAMPEQCYGARIELRMPTDVGRESGRSRVAAEPPYDDGNESEYAVDTKAVRFVFLDDNKRTMAVVSGAEQIRWEPDEEVGATTQTAQVQIKTEKRPAYLVVLLNVADEVAAKLTGNGVAYDYGTMQQPIAAPLATVSTVSVAAVKGAWLPYVANTLKAQGGFLMTNSTYVAKEALSGTAPTATEVVKAIPVADKIVPLEKMSEAEPIAVHVERVVAKATLAIDKTTAIGEVKNNTYKLTDGEHTFGVQLIGWTLNAANKSFCPLKELAGIGQEEWAHMFGNFTVSLADKGRSFWAVDGNYNNGNYPTNKDLATAVDYTAWGASYDLDYYTWTEASTANRDFTGGVASYCLENTMTVDIATRKEAVTHLLIAGRYTDGSGHALEEDVYRYDNKMYTAQQLGGCIKAELGRRGYKSDDVKDTDFKFVAENASSWKDHDDVKITKIYYTGTNAELKKFTEADNTSDLKTTALGWNTLWRYPEGKCYYTVPVRHFHVGSTAGKAGYYGMVRNHWYAVKVELKGFGEPVSPDKPVIPDESVDNTQAISAQINVLSWAKNAQETTVGGSTTWE